ncbi:MAG TPA: tetratricopeptide repeat protein [Pyrinomonadaceae bacterium]|nr:tetratricopeptide repeat protein [Pyrinomonadaceae bacterium]
MKKSRPHMPKDSRQNFLKESKQVPARPDSIPTNNILTESRALFLTVAATILVYANSLSGAFVFDDTKQIAGNPSLHSWGNILRAFTNDVWSFQRGTLTRDVPPPYYRPLFTIYLTVNYQLFGLWEPGWHLMNLLVHTTATVFVYYLLRRLTGDNLIALLTALLFGLHPAHVESVSWISGIPDPLAALFYVPSLIWYVRYREEGGAKWLAASVLAYGFASLCKETPLALPLVFVVWEFARGDQKKNLTARVREIAWQLIPYAAVAGAYLALRFSVLGRLSWKHPFMAQVPDSAIWMTVPYVFVNYVRHLIAPFRLSLIYGTSFVTSAADPRFLVPLTLLIGVAIMLWTYRKKLDRNLWIALTLTIAPLLPVLNLKVFHYEYIIQDRYLYLPSIGFCSLVALLLARLGRRNQRLLLATACVIIFVFGASTILQNRVWHDAAALWQRAIYYSPQSWSTHYNLGLAYLNFKQNDLARNELEEAKHLKSNEASIYNNLALAQAGVGDFNSAIANLKQALTLDPSLLEAHNNLGTILYEQSSYNDARSEFSLVLDRDPESVSAHFNLGRTLAALKDYSGAIREFESVLTLKPDDREARYELALSYAATNQKDKAIEQFNRAAATDRDSVRANDMRKKLEEVLRRTLS